jgi:hypothetical protein
MNNLEQENSSRGGSFIIPSVTDNRKKLIEITAYFRAEKRGFVPSNDLEDWLEAEQEVKRHLDSFSS